VAKTEELKNPPFMGQKKTKNHHVSFWKEPSRAGGWEGGLAGDKHGVGVWTADWKRTSVAGMEAHEPPRTEPEGWWVSQLSERVHAATAHIPHGCSAAQVRSKQRESVRSR